MRSLHHTIESVIVSHRMLDAGDTVVLAVSGGPDSVCLLHLMTALASRWNWMIHVAHLHHGIRGVDADKDARHVEEMARALGFPFYLHRCDVPRFAEQNGLGLEEAGRFLRYRLFSDLAGKVGAQAIATGHHADDQAETVLMNLLRGAGGTGLSGIQPVRRISDQLKVIRPLLYLTRREIEQYLDDAGIKAHHDRTNDQLNQTRNRIRHQLLPYLEQYNPRISEALARTADILRSDEHYLMQQVNDYLAENLIHQYGLYSLSADDLRDRPLALQRRIVRRMVELVNWEAKQSMKPHARGQVNDDVNASTNIGYGQTEGLLDLLQESSRPQQSPHYSWSAPLPGGIIARLSQGQLFFLPNMGVQSGFQSRDWRGPGELDLHEVACRVLMREVDRPESGWDRRKHLDHALMGQDLRLRSWRPGDRISLGPSSSKKLSDLFIDAKVPGPYRPRIPVVEFAGEIVAVTGLLVAPAYRPPVEAPMAVELQLVNADHRRKDYAHVKSNIQP